MLSIAKIMFSYVRAKLALVHNSNFRMGTDVTIQIANTDRVERAMGTRM